MRNQDASPYKTNSYAATNYNNILPSKFVAQSIIASQRLDKNFEEEPLNYLQRPASYNSSVPSLSKGDSQGDKMWNEIEASPDGMKTPQTSSGLNSKVVRECQSTCSEASLVEVSDDEDSKVNDSPKKNRLN